MCGISAIVSPRPAALAQAVVRMTQQVRHRGPDGEGYVVFSGAGLAPQTFGGAQTPAECIAPSHPFLPASRELPADGGLSVAFGHRRLSIVDLSPAGYQPMATPERDLWIVYNG